MVAAHNVKPAFAMVPGCVEVDPTYRLVKIATVLQVEFCLCVETDVSFATVAVPRGPKFSRFRDDLA